MTEYALDGPPSKLLTHKKRFPLFARRAYPEAQMQECTFTMWEKGEDKWCQMKGSLLKRRKRKCTERALVSSFNCTVTQRVTLTSYVWSRRIHETSRYMLSQSHNWRTFLPQIIAWPWRVDRQKLPLEQVQCNNGYIERLKNYHYGDPFGEEKSIKQWKLKNFYCPNILLNKIQLVNCHFPLGTIWTDESI